MWSNKKEVNIAINILLFLLAINIFHYGQFILPIICLILFIDNKFKFNVCNIKIFILLCLFGLTFFLFSYKLGFYSVMGFCIPMAYYIGSNIKEPSEDNIKKIIYIIAFGMASHVVLNFIYELSIDGFTYLNSFTHYDIWLQGKVQETLTAVNYMFLTACTYYLAIYEKNRNNKITGLIMLIIIFIYNIFLGRRTPVLMLGISIIVSLLLDLFVLNKNNVNKKTIYVLLLAILAPILLMIIVYLFNLFGLRQWIRGLKIVSKFLWVGLKSERLELFINGLKLMPYHLWGGQEISNSVGIYIHDLWMDTYDYAGIVPYVLLIIYSIYYLINMIKLVKNKNISNNYKLLFIVLFIVCFLQLCLDPIMTGSSIFLICVVIIGTCFERLNKYGK